MTQLVNLPYDIIEHLTLAQVLLQNPELDADKIKEHLNMALKSLQHYEYLRKASILPTTKALY